MGNVVKLERQRDVLIVTVDNPPVNALGADVRRGLIERLRGDK